MKKAFVGCLGLAVLLSACRSTEASGPQSLLGKFVLVRANDAQLPFLLSSDQYARYTLMGETLSFDGADSVLRTRTLYVEDFTRGTVNKVTSSFMQSFRVRDGTVEIGSFAGCPPNASCVPNDLGTVTGGSIFLSSWLYNRAALTYQKAGEL
jgi:hypothetical protein